MKHPLRTHLFTALALCSLSASALALGAGNLQGGPTSGVTDQVEQKAGRMVERAMDRRIAKRVEASTATERLAELPASLQVHTTSGAKAFNDVVLDDGYRTVERQWLVTGTDSEISSLDHPAITVLARRELSGLGMTVVRFRVTSELDSREALQAELPELAESLDRNHIYSPQTGSDKASKKPESPQWRTLCSDPVGIGMVDTSIATDHPVFSNARIEQERFLELEEGEGELREPRDHGTAVASLMVGSREDQWPARLPEARVFNASVFYDRGRSLSGATLGHLLEGLNWLAEQELSVINISLTGPKNRLLAAAVDNLYRQDIALVAAVGNQGPAAPPLYPAAYQDVVGVTAVDTSGELYRWANRGEQVMFAGPGVSVPVARADGKTAADSGTSLAAPVVAAALACHRADQPVDQAIDELIEQARDLGERGRDNSFGHGLLDL